MCVCDGWMNSVSYGVGMALQLFDCDFVDCVVWEGIAIR